VADFRDLDEAMAYLSGRFAETHPHLSECELRRHVSAAVEALKAADDLPGDLLTRGAVNEVIGATERHMHANTGLAAEINRWQREHGYGY
jgi:hypothetical protein